LEQQKLDYFHKRLLEEREVVQNQIQGMEDGALGIPLQESVSELSSYDNHPADLGSETFERSKDFSLRENALITLNKIEDALDRMERGMYGICERCGRAIPMERLEAIPLTTLCIDCRGEMEKVPDRRLRPIEEDVILPPFGTTREELMMKAFYGGKLDEVIFDGEDTWQAVSRYGSSEGPQDLPNNVRFPDMSIHEEEDIGWVEDVDAIPYYKGEDGMTYKDYGNLDDEDAPEGFSGHN